MDKKELFFLIIKVLPLPFLLLLSLNAARSLGEGNPSIGLFHNAEDCAFSPYNTYSNSTNGYSYVFGKCYVEIINGFYEDKEKCGFLGISCYERSEPVMMPIRGEVCFRLKDGERC